MMIIYNNSYNKLMNWNNKFKINSNKLINLKFIIINGSVKMVLVDKLIF